MDIIMNYQVKVTAKFAQFGGEVRAAQLRIDSGYLRQRMLQIKLPTPGKRRKAALKIHGCKEGGHGDGWCKSRGGRR